MTVNIILTSITAYFVSRKNVMWNRLMMFLIVITMYFNGGLIPNYLNIKQLGLYDTIWALILPGAISSYNMIIMRTAFLSVPDSLEEAARIDGANHFTILFRILFPLIMPTVAVLILYYAVGHWNGWFNAMIYLKSRTKYPLQLILREILINNDSSSMVATATGDTGDKLAISETVRYATIIWQHCQYFLYTRFFRNIL
ncbi:carbohydrate ABC transporter permease [Thermoclostridium stercorarium]|nr:carbohydrate ABC transporter permease [Thermoclostridium stercorarium]